MISRVRDWRFPLTSLNRTYQTLLLLLILLMRYGPEHRLTTSKANRLKQPIALCSWRVIPLADFRHIKPWGALSPQAEGLDTLRMSVQKLPCTGVPWASTAMVLRRRRLTRVNQILS